MSASYELIIVGGGVAGSAAALRAAQYQRRSLWIRGDKKTAKSSRGLWVHNIDNMISVHPGIMLDKVRRRLRGDEFAAAREALEDFHPAIGTRDLIENTLRRIKADYSDKIEIVDVAARSATRIDVGFEVHWDTGSATAPALVLATGAMDRQPEIMATNKSGLVDDNIKWIYPFANQESVLYCIRCEGHLTRSDQTVVIGSSEGAAQVSLMLKERYGTLSHILTNGAKPAWSERAGRILAHYDIQVRGERITNVSGSKGDLHEISLAGGDVLPVRFAFVALGLYRVYNELARSLGAELANQDKSVEERHVFVDARGETSVPALFAVGDMTTRPDEPIMKQVYTSQEYAVRAIDTIDRRIRKASRDAILAAKP